MPHDVKKYCEDCSRPDFCMFECCKDVDLRCCKAATGLVSMEDIENGLFSNGQVVTTVNDDVDVSPPIYEETHEFLRPHYSPKHTPELNRHLTKEMGHATSLPSVLTRFHRKTVPLVRKNDVKHSPEIIARNVDEMLNHDEQILEGAKKV